MLCVSGIMIPEFSSAETGGAKDGQATGAKQNENDKTKLIEKKIKYTVTQNGKKLSDLEDADLRIIDPKQPFEITVTFTFPIIKNNNIPGPLSQGIKDVSQQVDENDIANFTLGNHFEAFDDKNESIPVRIVAKNHPDNNKLVGNINITKSNDSKINAQMLFKSDSKDYYGAFDYEPETRKDITVQFTGKFKMSDKNPPVDPGSKDRVVKILDKEYKLPDLEDNTYYKFTKSGKIDSQEKKDSITWECNIRKVSDTKPSLAGEKFTDDLRNVGEYIEGSLILYDGNDTKIEYKDNYTNLKYDDATKTITYVFPKDFNSDKAKIKFQTKVSKKQIDNNKATVKNRAGLDIAATTTKIAETEVPVHNPLKITKALEKIIGKDPKTSKPVKQMIWTIVAGAPYENYGSAWIGDILSGEFENQVKPNRIELTYEHRNTDKENDWKLVSADSVKNKDKDKNFDPNTIPRFLDSDECPNDLPNDKDIEIYELGRDWKKNPSDIIKNNKEKNDKYSVVDNHWFFIKELKGQYRITVILYFDEDAEVGPLKNEAEIHTCNEKGIYTEKPAVFSATSSIKKEVGVRNPKNEKDRDDINKGIMPWNITVNFENVFPSDDRYVYEAFYWGDEKKFNEEKNGLKRPDGISEEVFNALKEDPNDKTNPVRFNFNQAYEKDSLSLISDPKETEGQEAGGSTVGGTPAPKETLRDDVFILKNKEDKNVGQIVKISGFKEIKTYKFTIKTRAQDIIESINKGTAAGDKTYYNTAVLAIGKDKTFKTLSNKASQPLPVKLLNKELLSRDTDFNKINNPVEDGSPSASNEPKYLTLKTVSDGNGGAFNYQDKTILFRIDVNPQGMDFKKYIEELRLKNDDTKDFKFDKLVVTDKLDNDLELVPIKGKDLYYIYEADKSTLSDLREAQIIKKMNPGEVKNANIDFNEKNKAWTFNNYNNKPYVIVIKAKVKNQALEKYIKESKEWGPNIIFNNNVSLTVNTRKMANAKAYESINKKPLTKENLTEAKDKNLKWTFTYQPFGVGGLRNVAFVDELNEKLALPVDNNGNIKLDNFEVKRSNDLQENGSYKKWENVEVHRGSSTPSSGVNVNYNDHKLTFKIPNNATSYSYKFTYNTNLNLNPNDLNNVPSIRNTVKMTANGKGTGAEGIADIQVQEYSAFATIKDNPYFVIKKVDDKGKPLAGAVFQYTDKDGNKTNYKTEKDGLIYVINITDNSDTKVEEIKAPDGYVRFSQPIVIIIAKGKATVKPSTKLDGEGTQDKPFLIKNHKSSHNYTSIDVTKRWVGDKASERPKDITVTLIKDGVSTDKTITLNESNGWKGSFKYLPITDGHGNIIKYTVSETKVPNYSSDISGDKYSGFVITNTKSEELGNPPREEGSKPKDPGTGDNTSLYAWGITALISALGYVFLRRKVH